MRGEDVKQAAVFSYVSAEERVPLDHPLRRIREMTNAALTQMSGLFAELYAPGGRPSIPPEQLLRALLLQVLFSIRSERMLMEQLSYNLLYQWFVGLNMDDQVWDVTVFTKNRDRLLDGEVAAQFFAAVLEQARSSSLLSDEHFSVDGTLVQAWAGHKSFRPKGRPPGGGDQAEDWRGQTRSNSTHASSTDPDARLFRKSVGVESKLVYMGHVLMENRHGLITDTELTRATGTAECEAALQMVMRSRFTPKTVGGDKGYDRQGFVQQVRQHGVTPHVAQKRQYSAIDGRTTRHLGYAQSQTVRKRIEQVFGWMKSVGGLRQTKLRGQARVRWQFQFVATAYNLVRLLGLAAAPS